MLENNFKIESSEPKSINNGKTITRMVVIVVLLVIVAFAWIFFGKNNFENKKGEITNFETIRDVMNTNKLYSCNFEMNDGERSFSSNILVHGNKFHTAIKMNNDVMHELFDGNVQYVWENSTQKGFFLERSCFTKKGKNIEDFVMETADVTGGKIECTLATDENFSKPDGIDLINGCDKF